MCFDFQILLNFRVAGLPEIAQVNPAWHYFNRVWLKFIQFLRWKRRKAAINIPQGRSRFHLGMRGRTGLLKCGSANELRTIIQDSA